MGRMAYASSVAQAQSPQWRSLVMGYAFLYTNYAIICVSPAYHHQYANPEKTARMRRLGLSYAGSILQQ
ncbi:hypothetical protein DPMN_117228, partial [Dreissena polymorpha]